MTRRLRTLGALALAAALAWAPKSARAIVYAWNNAGGGNFATNTNWTPNGLPVSGDTVNFVLNATYQVDFTAAAATADANLSAPAPGATLTLALGGYTWSSGRILGGYGVSGNTLTISGGTLTAGGHFAFGAGNGSGNTLNVSGAGTSLTTTSYDLGFGYYIDGGNYGNSNTMTISAGAAAIAGRTFYLGAGTATGNLVTVTGTNSKLQANSTLQVGGTGNSLRAESGGLVTANSTVGGTANSVVIDNATWSGASYLYLAGNLNTATVQNNGAMNAGDIRVGSSGAGGNTLTVTSGTVTGTGHFCLGTSGSSGNTVLVTGASSLVKTNSFDVAVGSYAGGSGGGNDNLLRVENGGQVTVARTLFAGGDGALSGNAVLVTGTGSAIQAQNVDVRGSGGNNRLTVSAGGTVGATQNADLRGSGNAIVVDGGTLTANGALTVWNTNNTVTAKNAGVLTGGNAWFGRGSTTSGAALSVESGAVVTGSGHLVVGYDGATGTTATVTGAGSLLKCNSWDLGIGNYSGGATNTANGTTVTVSAGGEIRAQRTLFIGAGAASNNTLTVSGTGSLARAMTTSIEVNGSGGGNSLLLQDGGSANAPNVILTGSGNALTVDNATLTGTYLYTRGTGNTMDVSGGGTVTFGQVEVGNGGSGSALNLSNGTITATGHFYMGTGGGTGATVNVTGPAAQLKTNAYDLHLGQNGTNNTLTVAGGAKVDIQRHTYVGETNTATGNRLLVTGAGSQLTTALNGQYWDTRLYVGNATAGSNTVEVSAGGTLDTLGIIVGSAAGNAVTNTGGVYQFRYANPTLTPGAGGIHLTDGTISYRNIPDADVDLNVTGNLATITFAGNNTFMLNNSSSVGYNDQTYTYDSLANSGNPRNYQRLALVNGTTSIPLGAITIGGGGALLADNTAASIGQTLANSGTIEVRAGASLAVGTFSQGAGTTLVNGTLSSANPIAVGGGVLGGGGTVSGALVLSGTGSVNPGSSIGTLAVNGSATFNSGAALVAELDNAGNADLLAVTGNLNLNSGSRLDLELLNYGLAGSYTLATWTGTLTGTFSEVYLQGVLQPDPTALGGIDGKFQLLYGGNSLILVPEPAAALLFALGLAAAAVRPRRRHG